MEPSTKPLLERVYDVAKPGADSEDMRRRRPWGVWKSRRALYNGQRDEWTQDTAKFTIGRGCQGAVRIVMIPQRRRVKGILDIVHELDHLIYIMTRLCDDETSS
jgi:hypothetical protein